ncbi:hypothetical protein CsSME_00019003 [Camellia sinensis var. sinensis]
MAESVSLYSLLASHDYVILVVDPKEKEIAIVTHSGFLFHVHFANCELRSMVIVDKSMSESDPPTTNYPGKIPPDHDAPSDVVDEKN